MIRIGRTPPIAISEYVDVPFCSKLGVGKEILRVAEGELGIGSPTVDMISSEVPPRIIAGIYMGCSY